MFKFLQKLFSSGKGNLKNVLSENPIIIDVRTPEEYRAGHIKQSRNIPLNKLKSSVSEIKAYNRPVITVCRSGSRSAMARNMLTESGIRVYNGGGWTELKRIIESAQPSSISEKGRKS